MNNQLPHARETPLGPHDTDQERGPRTVHRQWLFAGVGAVLVVVAVIVGVFAFGMLPLPGDAAVEPALGPGRIAFVSDRDGDSEIYVMNADGSGVVQLTDNDAEDGDPAWSPDGRRIVFASDRDNDLEIDDIYVMNVDGGGVEQLTDDCSNGHLAWSPGGDRIAFASDGGIYVMNADGTGAVQLTGKRRDSCLALFFSDRDGQYAWYVRKADGSVELFTDFDSGDLGLGDSEPVWSPDGSRIAYQSMRDDDIGIYAMNADGTGVERLNHNVMDFFFGVAWSPDGDRLAFGSTPELDLQAGLFETNVYLINVDGSGLERLTDNEHVDGYPAWSPDGGRIAFASLPGDGDGDYGIYVMNADGTGVVRLADGHSPAWSPLLD